MNDDFDKAWADLKAELHKALITERGYLFFVGMWVGIIVGGVAVWWNP